MNPCKKVTNKLRVAGELKLAAANVVHPDSRNTCRSPGCQVYELNNHKSSEMTEVVA